MMARQSNSGWKHPLAPIAAAADAPLGDHLYFYLTQLEHAFRSSIEVSLEEFDLDIREYTALAYIVDGHGPTQYELGNLLRLDPSQVVTLTKRLVNRGLVSRETFTRDRRAKVLNITADGRRLYAQAASTIRRIEESLTAALARRDRVALQSLLDRLLPRP